MSTNDGGADAGSEPNPEPEPLDIDAAFAAIVAGWADEHPATWPAQEDLNLGRHRRTDDPPEVVEGRLPEGSGPESRRKDDARPGDRRTDDPAGPGRPGRKPSDGDRTGSDRVGPDPGDPGRRDPGDPGGTDLTDPGQPDRGPADRPRPVHDRRTGDRPGGRRADGRRPGDRRREDTDRADDDLALNGSFTDPVLPSVEPTEHGPEDLLDQYDRFVPPDPPMPRGDLISTLAWACVTMGPVVLLFSVLFWGRDAPRMLVLGAVAAFIGGFVTLVSRLPRHRDDDDDDGAVV